MTDSDHEHIDHIDPLFTGDLTYIHGPYHSDTHPDPLREWADYGDTTPEGWFAVRAYTRSMTALYLAREIHGDLHDRILRDSRDGLLSRVRYVDTGAQLILSRVVWWTPSEELACDVARQYRDGERQAFLYAPYPGSNNAVQRLRAWRATVHRHMPGGRAHWVAEYIRTTPHPDATPCEYGYAPPMKTWGIPGQDVDYPVMSADGKMIR